MTVIVPDDHDDRIRNNYDDVEDGETDDDYASDESDSNDDNYE